MLRLGTITGSYGRDYKSKAALLNDWNAGRDFQDSWSGQQINRSDADQLKVTTIQARYNGLRSVTVLTRTKQGHWKAS